MQKMTSAWVIIQEGTSYPTEVIGILSARKAARIIREYVEWLYALLHYDPEEHLAFAKYTKPSIPYEAEFMRTNTGARMESFITCGHNPYLVACYAKNLKLEKSDTGATLEWTNPDRIECDPQTLRVVNVVPGMTQKAPVRLPFNFKIIQ